MGRRLDRGASPSVRVRPVAAWRFALAPRPPLTLRTLRPTLQVLTGESWSEAVVRPLLFGWDPRNAALVGIFFTVYILLTQVEAHSRGFLCCLCLASPPLPRLHPPLLPSVPRLPPLPPPSPPHGLVSTLTSPSPLPPLASPLPSGSPLTPLCAPLPPQKQVVLQNVVVAVLLDKFVESDDSDEGAGSAATEDVFHIAVKNNPTDAAIAQAATSSGVAVPTTPPRSPDPAPFNSAEATVSALLKDAEQIKADQALIKVGIQAILSRLPSSSDRERLEA